MKQLGDGTYGSVWKAINRQTNDVVRPGSSVTLSPGLAQGLWGMPLSAGLHKAAVAHGLALAPHLDTPGPAAAWQLAA